MSWLNRALVWLVASVACASSASAQEPASKPKVKVEFRWLERKPIAEVTAGFEYPGEDDRVFYPHRKAVLTNEDIVKVRIIESQLGWGAQFQLTPTALEKLASSCGGPSKMLVIRIVGYPWGYPVYSPGIRFEPIAGWFTKDLADHLAKEFPR